MTQKNVLISGVGGGAVGATAADLLLRAGWQVTVVEKAPGPAGRNDALHDLSGGTLGRCGRRSAEPRTNCCCSTGL